MENLIPKGYTEKYKQYKQLEKELAEMEKQFKTDLVEKLGNSIDNSSKAAIVVDNVTFSYVKGSTRTTIDSKRLQEEEPELYEKYLKETRIKPTIRITL